MNCDWCERPFEPKGRLQRFCCAAHRNAFHSATRKFTADMLDKGFISKADLRRRYGPDQASSEGK